MAGAMVMSASLTAAQAPPAQTPPAQTPPAQTPRPTPTPFPRGGTDPAPAQPKPAANPPAATAAPAGASDLGALDPRLAGIAGYPAAEFLGSYDAGTNQRLFMFGTNESYDAVLTFYKAQFKKAGEEISRQPRIQQFEFGAFNSATMSQRPSVIVKDYTVPDPAGYLHVSGTTEKRFKTLIQIIPVVK